VGNTHIDSSRLRNKPIHSFKPFCFVSTLAKLFHILYLNYLVENLIFGVGWSQIFAVQSVSAVSTNFLKWHPINSSPDLLIWCPLRFQKYDSLIIIFNFYFTIHILQHEIFAFKQITSRILSTSSKFKAPDKGKIFQKYPAQVFCEAGKTYKWCACGHSAKQVNSRWRDFTIWGDAEIATTTATTTATTAATTTTTATSKP